MNLNLYGHNKEWLIVDCGITFGDRLGVEIIMPDPAFIAERRDHISGMIITHAHEDHVGAVPYLWPQLQCPVYATPFTASILRQKLKELPWGKKVKIIEVPLSGTIEVGKFTVEFITLTHSIPEPNALAISTPLGTILHTGDWKIDTNPLVGEVTDHTRLEELGDRGVLAMVCDSTNVFTEGTSGSEQGVRDELTDLIRRHPEGRVVVACFASNVARFETAAFAAKATNRIPVLVGRSLSRMEEAARQSGYLKDFPPFLREEDAADIPRNKALLIATGSQGEPRSALARMAAGQHPAIELEPEDTVIFSSRMIPGNERSISALQNRLVLKGIKVITAHEEDIHVSGHPARDELRQMYSWVRPEILVPVHGEARHMQAQATLGLECGIPKAVIPENGSLIHLASGLPKIVDQLPSGRLGVDGERLIPMDSLMLRERYKLSLQGTLVVTIALDRAGQSARPLQVTMLGVAEAGEETDDLTKHIQKAIRQTLKEEFKNEDALKEALRIAIRRAANSRLGKKPLTEVHLIKI
jgi:ribonuclease J